MREGHRGDERGIAHCERKDTELGITPTPGQVVRWNAGLVGYFCDVRNLSQIDSVEFGADTRRRNLCVNPTCGD